MRTIDELVISPTPWSIDRWNDINDTRGYTIASVIDSDGCYKEEEEANARLIAAAPEMYQAIYRLLMASDYGVSIHRQLDECRAALAKASGEENE